MNIFKKFIAYLALNARVNEAKALFRKDGQRRFVIPFNDGKMEVLTKGEALCLRDQGLLARDLSARTIYGACFFWTGTNVEHERTQCEMPKVEFKRRRKFFYTWFDKHHSK